MHMKDLCSGRTGKHIAVAERRECHDAVVHGRERRLRVAPVDVDLCVRDGVDHRDEDRPHRPSEERTSTVGGDPPQPVQPLVPIRLVPELVEQDPERFAKVANRGSGCAGVILLAAALTGLAMI